MGYKHSPANAKMNAFMQKMNNTEKSPAKQVDDEKAISQRDKDYDKKKKAAELTFTTRMKESGLSCGWQPPLPTHGVCMPYGPL